MCGSCNGVVGEAGNVECGRLHRHVVVSSGVAGRLGGRVCLLSCAYERKGYGEKEAVMTSSWIRQIPEIKKGVAG